MSTVTNTQTLWLAAVLVASFFGREIARVAWRRALSPIYYRIFPKPIHGVFYTEEFENGHRVVRRYVDGKLSRKRIDMPADDGSPASVQTGSGSPISDPEFNLDHGDHRELVKQLRLREQ